MARKIRKLQKKNCAFGIESIFSTPKRFIALQKEIKYISWCRQIGIKLCNNTDGGDGGTGRRLSQTQKEHLRKVNTGKNNPQWGKTPSEKTREKQRAALKGKSRPRAQNYNLWKRRISENHADVSGEKNPMFGKPAPTRKKTIQYDLHNNKIAEFPSATAAAKAIGLARVTISLCASGKIPTAGGFAWKYE